MTSKTRHILLTSSVMLVAIMLVSILAWKSLSPINSKSGFNRTINPGKLNLVSVTKRNVDVVDFAGSTKYHLYWKTTNPSKVFQTDVNLGNGTYITFEVPQNKKLASAFYSLVDSPDITILAGRLPAVIIANPDSSTKIYKFPSQLFTRGVKIGVGSFVFRGFDTSVRTMDQIFLKANLLSGKVSVENKISDLKGDGGISTDGTLHYDKESAILAYILFYENKFLCLDTNLNLIKRGSTIDTISTYQGNAVEVDSKNAITNLTPTRFVNSLNCVQAGMLYNNSKIKGDNEELEIFNNNSVIDIYNLKSGQYQQSFYIPKYNGQRMIQFKVVSDSLFVLYNDFIAKYSLPDLTITNKTPSS